MGYSRIRLTKTKRTIIKKKENNRRRKTLKKRAR